MFVALATAIAIGGVVAGAAIADRRLQIADEAWLALLVCISGAVAGWAVVDTISGVGTEGFGPWDAAGALAGALGMAQAAWRGRRRTFADLEIAEHDAEVDGSTDERASERARQTQLV